MNDPSPYDAEPMRRAKEIVAARRKEREREEKIRAIRESYDRGCGLDLIIQAAGGYAEENLVLVHQRLGTAMSTLRRYAAEAAARPTTERNA